jgi:hypothetical protein
MLPSILLKPHTAPPAIEHPLLCRGEAEEADAVGVEQPLQDFLGDAVDGLAGVFFDEDSEERLEGTRRTIGISGRSP